jgi:hypothetical protein
MSNGYGGMDPVNQAYHEAVRNGILKHLKQLSIGPCRQNFRGKGSDNVLLCREICVTTLNTFGNVL